MEIPENPFTAVRTAVQILRAHRIRIEMLSMHPEVAAGLLNSQDAIYLMDRQWKEGDSVPTDTLCGIPFIQKV